MSDKYFNIENISKKYTDKVGYTINLLKDISLNISKSNFTSVIAPVGSGKTSLLKILSGLDSPTSGKISTNLERRIFIPSSPSSFPWLNVLDNISFNSSLTNKEIVDIIKSVGLNGYENHYPHNNSEGFRFRISLGRAIANNPEMIIIDEPFNNLNAATRTEIYILLRSIINKYSIPIIFGTTNITEAIFLSEEIYLMKKNPGEIIDKIIVDFPANRSTDIFESDKFNELRTKIENIFKKKTDSQLYNFSI